MPDMYMSTQNLTVGSAKECESACIRNCSCSAYSYIGGCSIWSGGLQNLKQLSVGDSNGTVTYIQLTTSDPPTIKGKYKKVLTMVIVVASMCSLALLGIILLLIWSKQLVGPSSAALSNFSPIAIKILEGFRQGEKEFQAEVSLVCLRGLLDSKLEGNFDEDQVTRACNTACWCIQEGEMNKPSMGYAVQVLKGVIEYGSSSFCKKKRKNYFVHGMEKYYIIITIVLEDRYFQAKYDLNRCIYGSFVGRIICASAHTLVIAEDHRSSLNSKHEETK
ncbi:hypothetical protein GIB67_013799 [Kingdonia uniflora]|uniref:Apple domain-containing protein n=1 Tax=Kingdonia uniflora TaxID=39325 RepID=A0A7J7N7V1_9MAGN|nr:hypothetical protein GIB67_013799 [Kingdonia uniflora]